MNRELLYEVADAIEKEQAYDEIIEFDMGLWGSRGSCGTICCVAGTIAFMDAIEKGMTEKTRSESWWTAHAPNIGQRKLGISSEEARHLFTGDEYMVPSTGIWIADKSLDMINRDKKYVPDALRWMAETGVIDWHSGLKAAKCLAKERAREQAKEDQEA